MSGALGCLADKTFDLLQFDIRVLICHRSSTCFDSLFPRRGLVQSNTASLVREDLTQGREGRTQRVLVSFRLKFAQVLSPPFSFSCHFALNIA